MSILSNQTPKDLEKHPDEKTKQTGTVYDSCYFEGTYKTEMNCDDCPHNKHCSWYSEKEFRKED